jgi:hypothetical protein
MVVELEELVQNARAEAFKFEEKGVKASGPRVRKIMQEVKNLAQEIRVEVLERKEK